jgi:D-arginine dehydrogenase
MDADFLIIGGGVAGISAAARLAPLGKVLVLEAEDHLAHHASGRSAAMYEPRYGAPTVVGLSLASGDFLRGIPNVLSARGLLMLAKADQRDLMRHDCEVQELTRISVDEAVAMVPILNRETVAEAAFANHGWDLDTDLLIQTYLRMARAHGAEVKTKARVSAIQREAAR